MSADGKWKITLATPMGPQVMTADLTTEGETLTGSVSSDMGSEQIQGTVSGDTLNWTMNVTKPVAIKLTFDIKVEGDAMSGKAKLGMFGNANLVGERI